MPKAGLEPARAFAREILSLLCLPISPPRRGCHGAIGPDGFEPSPPVPKTGVLPPLRPVVLWVLAQLVAITGRRVQSPNLRLLSHNDKI